MDQIGRDFSYFHYFVVLGDVMLLIFKHMFITYQQGISCRQVYWYRSHAVSALWPYETKVASQESGPLVSLVTR